MSVWNFKGTSPLKTCFVQQVQEIDINNSSKTEKFVSRGYDEKVKINEFVLECPLIYVKFCIRVSLVTIIGIGKYRHCHSPPVAYRGVCDVWHKAMPVCNTLFKSSFAINKTKQKSSFSSFDVNSTVYLQQNHNLSAFIFTSSTRHDTELQPHRRQEINFSVDF